MSYSIPTQQNGETSIIIDSIHGDFLKEFKHDREVIIPQLKHSKSQLKRQLRALKRANITERNVIVDRINEIDKHMSELKAKKHAYIMDNTHYLFDYFENKQSIAAVPRPFTSTPDPFSTEFTHTNSKIYTNNKDINAFFKINATSSKSTSAPAIVSVSSNTSDEAKIELSASGPSASEPSASDQGDGDTPKIMSMPLMPIVQQPKRKPVHFIRGYLSNVNKQVLCDGAFINSTTECPYCTQTDELGVEATGDLMLIENEGIYICMTCAATIPCLIENEKSSYKEPPKEVSFYAYRKINHFKEIITQFQAKETTTIPDAVIQAIRRQIKRDHIPLSALTYYKTKDLLKSLQLSKYYEHIAYIKSMLGIRPPNFSTEFEETLRSLFLEIQGPYAEVCATDQRVNFLGYYYVLYKLCEKCGQTQYLRDIPLLKDTDKLVAQDEAWKQICAHQSLQWEFKHTNQDYISRPMAGRTVIDLMRAQTS